MCFQGGDLIEDADIRAGRGSTPGDEDQYEQKHNLSQTSLHGIPLFMWILEESSHTSQRILNRSIHPSLYSSVGGQTGSAPEHYWSIAEILQTSFDNDPVSSKGAEISPTSRTSPSPHARTFPKCSKRVPGGRHPSVSLSQVSALELVLVCTHKRFPGDT